MDSVAVLRALRHLQRLIAGLESHSAITDRLQAHVVASDGLGGSSRLLPELELVLRAKRLIVLSEIETLRRLTERGRNQPPPSWEPFAGIEDLSFYTQDTLRRITNGWITYRDSANVSRASYRNAMHDALAEMRTLGHLSELAAFLRLVATLPRRKAFRAACARISATLTDVDPDIPQRPNQGAEP